VTFLDPSRSHALCKQAAGLLVAAAVWGAPAALAEPFAFVTGDLGTLGGIAQADALFLVDLATAEAVFIGRVEDDTTPGLFYGSLGGLAIEPSTGRLYTISDSTGDAFLNVDPETARATAVAALNQGGTPFASITGFGLGFDAMGTLYMSSNFRLAELDPSDANVLDILVGGGATSPNNSEALATDDTHIWMLKENGSDHELVRVEKVAPGDPIPPTFFTSIGTLTPAISNADPGLDMAPDGVLWGVTRRTSSGLVGSQLFQIDKTTAVVSGMTLLTVPATSQVIRNARSIAIVGDVRVAFGSGNPWLAGMPDGSTDNGSDLAPDQSPRRVLVVDVSGLSTIGFSATGGANIVPGCPVPASFPECLPPDGDPNDVGPHTATPDGASNGIGNLVGPYAALVGVFLDGAQPDSSPAPPGLDFSSSGLGKDFIQLYPSLKQPFFIGDGSTSALQTQVFHVPPGATRLYLGVHDGTGWFNNSGQLEVEIIPNPSVTKLPVLAPAVGLLLAATLLLAGRRAGSS
jgi:hypothetical protein